SRDIPAHVHGRRPPAVALDTGHFLPDLGTDRMGRHTADAIHTAAGPARPADALHQHDRLSRARGYLAAMAVPANALRRAILCAAPLIAGLAPVEDCHRGHMAARVSRGAKGHQRLYHL